MVSKATKIGVGLSALFAVVAGTAGWIYLEIKDNLLNDDELVEYAQERIDNSFGGEGVVCAPIENMSTFFTEEDQEITSNLIADMGTIETGRRLLDTRRNILEDLVVCFGENFSGSNGSDTTHGFYLDSDKQYRGIDYYTVTIIGLERRDYNSMLMSMIHEYAHREKFSLLGGYQLAALTEQSKMLVRASAEAFSRATTVEAGIQFSEIGRPQILTDYHSECESIDACDNNLITAYIENTDFPLYQSMLAWLSPENVALYSRLNINRDASTLTEPTDHNCETRALQSAPDYSDINQSDRSLIARYIRPTGQSFTETPQPIEYKQANTIVRQTLRSAAVAELCIN